MRTRLDSRQGVDRGKRTIVRPVADLGEQLCFAVPAVALGQDSCSINACEPLESSQPRFMDTTDCVFIFWSGTSHPGLAADVGLGICSAAQLFDLDSVPCKPLATIWSSRSRI
ncbi:MAG: hypothetical protein OJF51_005020 [Nitrospira sp.]|nr:MAG: hypothetical protein OJF51_005020 [Nitrospira sp.]